MSDELDPRGLIREAYAIEGIEAGECRSIFLDWALFDVAPEAQSAALAALLARFEPPHPAHPMTAILRDALEGEATPRRRGGRRGRRREGR